jgi:hypothetical protein
MTAALISLHELHKSINRRRRPGRSIAQCRRCELAILAGFLQLALAEKSNCHSKKRIGADRRPLRRPRAVAHSQRGAGAKGHVESSAPLRRRASARSSATSRRAVVGAAIRIPTLLAKGVDAHFCHAERAGDQFGLGIGGLQQACEPIMHQLRRISAPPFAYPVTNLSWLPTHKCVRLRTAPAVLLSASTAAADTESG